MEWKFVLRTYGLTDCIPFRGNNHYPFAIVWPCSSLSSCSSCCSCTTSLVSLLAFCLLACRPPSVSLSALRWNNQYCNTVLTRDMWGSSFPRPPLDELGQWVADSVRRIGRLDRWMEVGRDGRTDRRWIVMVRSWILPPDFHFAVLLPIDSSLPDRPRFTIWIFDSWNGLPRSRPPSLTCCKGKWNSPTRAGSMYQVYILFYYIIFCLHPSWLNHTYNNRDPTIYYVSLMLNIFVVVLSCNVRSYSATSLSVKSSCPKTTTCTCILSLYEQLRRFPSPSSS